VRKAARNITIGQSAKNMFVVAVGGLWPAQLAALFQVSGKPVTSPHFSEGHGRGAFAVGKRESSRSPQLKQTGKIQKKGGELRAASR